MMPAFDAGIWREARKGDNHEGSGPDWKDIVIVKQSGFLSFRKKMKPKKSRPTRGGLSLILLDRLLLGEVLKRFLFQAG